MKLRDLFVGWSKLEYSLPVRVISLIFAGSFFVLGFPYLLYLSSRLDNTWGLGGFYFGYVNIIVGIAISTLGLYLAFWTVIIQMTLGKGTPIPAIPTKKLLIVGPYRYSRNPMVFGTLAYYYGVSIILGSFAAIGVTLLMTICIIVYIKAIEEKELEARFGQEYKAYKQSTSFMIPLCKKTSKDTAKELL